MSSSLPARPGHRPRTTPTNPHTQLDQQPADTRRRDEAELDVIERLVRASHAFARPGAATSVQ